MNHLQIILLAIAEAVILFFVLLLGGCVGIRIRYRNRFVLYLRILFLSIPIYRGSDPKKPKRIKSPKQILREEKKKRKKKEKAARKKAKSAEKKRKQKEKQSGSVSLNALDKVQLGLAIVKESLNDVKGNITVKFKKMHIYVGTGNAASTAILYGLILRGVTAICEIVERKITHVERKPNAMTVEADYEAKTTTSDIDVICSIRTVKGIGIALHILSDFKFKKAEMLKKKKEKKEE